MASNRRDFLKKAVAGSAAMVLPAYGQQRQAQPDRSKAQTLLPRWRGFNLLDMFTMRSRGQEVEDPTLIAHWALDEAEGMVAYDSAGTCDGTLAGDPVWQPGGGQIGGALQLDGVDDFAHAPFVLSPAEGPFSAFAWVRGGAPGQVIISQASGADWLLADPAGGSLMTDLKDSPRSASLPSEAVITDGDWHRVGLAWDGSSRMLYVDDVLVAQDAQGAAEKSSGGITIGGGHELALGTLFSGLIDDVRIYSRAVKP